MYTSAINVIASISDVNFIYDVIMSYSKDKDIKYIYDKLFKTDKYNIRTIKSRKRFINAILASFSEFINDNQKIVFLNSIEQNHLINIKKISLYIQLSINDKLFYDICKQEYG